MVKILLSCNTETYDIASDLGAEIQQQLGFKVALDMEDESSHHDDDDSFHEEELSDASALLVFQFGDENISAWVTIEDTDEKSTAKSKHEESLFPEIINFSKSVERGIRILKIVLVQDFGLIVRSGEEPKAPKVLAVQQQQYSDTKPGLLRKMAKLFAKSGRQLSQ
ncbi:MAG: hypothetical protein SGBAC_005682 [Bacillariaceae sp.]